MSRFLTMRKRLGGFALIAGLLLAGSACSSPELGLDTAPAGPEASSSFEIGFGAPEMTYAGEVRDGKLCIWVDTGAGNLVAVRWPAGSVAKRDPLRVEDSSGKTLARVGDHLTGQEGGTSLEKPGCHPGSTSTFLLSELPI